MYPHNCSKNILIENNICGVLASPSQNGKYPCILLLHGFAADKNEFKNIFVYIANELLKQNICSLRIDFRGWGESKGTTDQSTINTMIEDCIASVNYLKKQDNIDIDNIGVVGFSLGAAIAMLSIDKIRCNSLALISPALDLIKDFNAFLGNEVMQKLENAKTVVDVRLPWRDVILGPSFYPSLKNPLELIKNYNSNLYCIAGSKDFSAENAKKIINNKPDNKVLMLIDDADHVFNLSSGQNDIIKVADMVVGWLSHIHITRE